MVYHVLKTGEVKKDLTGHVIKMSDVPALYQILHTIKKENKDERKVKTV